MGNENVIEVEPNRQYILAGDISASMNSTDAKCAGLTRYNYMVEKFRSFIKISEDYDPDGPTIILFGENVKVFRNTTLSAIDSKLENVNFEGFTATDKAIDEAFKLHKEEKSELAKAGKAHPGTVLMIFTDGAPTNRAAVGRSIINIANSIDTREEFSIIFLTVGTIAPDLRDWLTMIDDNLKEAKHDIVDVKALEDVSFLGAVKGALTD
jgi:hypothetical protein